MKIVARKKFWFAISSLLFVISVLAIGIWGLKLGIDFTGGSVMEYSIPNANETVKEEVFEVVKQTEQNLKTTTGADLGEPVVFLSEQGVTVRTKPLDAASHDALKQAVLTKFPNAMESKFTSIGPTVGETIKQKALLALSISLVGMIVFIAFAFRKIPKKVSPWKFGVTAVIALFHDLIITIGIFVFLGHFFNVEVGSFFVTALLTVLGFSMHDTIVVFDRIRENMIHQKREESFADIGEKSIQQTMARSINTSLTTVITLFLLFLMGSESIRWFVFAILIGIVFGTYSSIFIATPLLVAWKEKDAR